MGSVRKRGKTWNAQVRVSGWRSFTKSFKSKSDALCWIKVLESNLKSADIPKVNIGNITLKDLLQRYATEMSLHLKGSEVQIYVLNFYARHPIAQIKLSDLTERHFEYLRDERLKQVKHGTVHAQLMLIKRFFRTAIYKWLYGIPKNPIEHLKLPLLINRANEGWQAMKKNAYSLPLALRKISILPLLLNSQSRRECVVLKY